MRRGTGAHVLSRIVPAALAALASLLTLPASAQSMAPQSTPSPAASSSAASPAPVADPKIEALAKTLVHQAQTNTLDPSEFDDQTKSALTPDMGKSIATELAPFGAATAFAYAGSEARQGLMVYGFVVTFASGSVREVFALDASGKIAGLHFTPI